MRTQFQKTLLEFDLRLTEVCAATKIDTALEKQREIIRLIDNFVECINNCSIDREELIEINFSLKEILRECITNRNHLGDFNLVYEEQNDEIIRQIQCLIRKITRTLRRTLSEGH